MADFQAVPLAGYLKEILSVEGRSKLRDEVLPGLLECISNIAQALRSSTQVAQVGTANAFGDDQLNVDVIAETIVRDAIKKIPAICVASSEEDPVEALVNNAPKDREQYTIAFDPLDGSSIIAPNWTVGTIMGIWDGPFAVNRAPEQQIAALLGVLGPRTTAFVALRLPGVEGTCFEISVSGASLCVIRPAVRLVAPPFKTRYFAPANLRSAAENSKYMQLITHFIGENYTLRYIGGLVPDIAHALVKGHGVYINPVTATNKAKLRRLYELAPIALIVECAGGYAVDEKGARILGSIIRNTDERAGLLCGTRDEVLFVKRQLGL